jgi:hypothetical protein
MPTLKSHLRNLTKDQLVNHIQELYKKYPQVKEYYDFYFHPNETEMLEKYRKVIMDEFFPKRGKPKIRFSVAKKAISGFRALGPSPKHLADLRLTLPEAATQFTCDYGDMWEQYYISASNNFKAALKYMQKEGLLDRYKNRIDKCVAQASQCGWGFGDDINEIYYEYFKP